MSTELRTRCLRLNESLVDSLLSAKTDQERQEIVRHLALWVELLGSLYPYDLCRSYRLCLRIVQLDPCVEFGPESPIVNKLERVLRNPLGEELTKDERDEIAISLIKYFDPEGNFDAKGHEAEEIMYQLDWEENWAD